MFIRDLSFGDFIEIEILREEGSLPIKVKAKVDNIKGNTLKAVTSNPIRVLEEVLTVYVYYKSEGKCKRWNCQFLGYERSKHVNLIVLSCDEKAESANSRSAFRVPYNEDIEYEFKENKYKGRLRDISAGGVGFFSNKEHKKGDKISFILEDFGYRLELEGVIVRKEEQMDREIVFDFLYGLKFDEVNEDVMAFVFKRQLEILRSRKLVED